MIAGGLLVVAGCGSASPTLTPPAAAASAAPAAAAPPTPGTAQLAAAYKACADTSNAANTAIMDTAFMTLGEANQIAQQLASNEGSFIACIRAIPWTPPFQPDVHDLLVAASSSQVTDLLMAQAPTSVKYRSLFATWQSQNLAEGSKANQLRGDLGLPPPPIFVATPAPGCTCWPGSSP